MVRPASAIAAFALSVVVCTGVLSTSVARAAACVSSTGPGIAPPASIASGQSGFHAAWYGQSGYMALCPGDSAVATVAYYNTGSLGWVSGRLGEVAYLGTSGPQPGQDQASPLGGDGTNGSPATGWPRFNRLAVQPAPYVGPGQVAWFQFRVKAPAVPGRYSLALRPLIEGAQWMEDFGVFWSVVVLNPDGTQPPLALGGLTFNPTSTTRADLYTEMAITKSDTTSIIAVIDGDMARIEADLGRAFAGRPTLFVFASANSAILGLQTIARRTALEAAQLVTHGGLYDPVTGSIFIIWSNVAHVPINVVRHELTHHLFQQIAGPGASIPAWFNEGNAVLEQLTTTGSTWQASVYHYTAASAASLSPSPLFPLSDLVSQATWNARTGLLGRFEYYEAAEAARVVREDVGIRGTVLILELMSRGQTFDAALFAITGKSADAYASQFPTRLKSTVPAYPGVALANDTAVGPGVTFTAYGFAPATLLNVSISTPGYQTVTTSVVTNTFGTYWDYLSVANGWPPLGNYTVTVSDGTRTVTSTTVLSAIVDETRGPRHPFFA